MQRHTKHLLFAMTVIYLPVAALITWGLAYFGEPRSVWLVGLVRSLFN